MPEIYHQLKYQTNACASLNFSELGSTGARGFRWVRTKLVRTRRQSRHNDVITDLPYSKYAKRRRAERVFTSRCNFR